MPDTRPGLLTLLIIEPGLELLDSHVDLFIEGFDDFVLLVAFEIVELDVLIRLDRFVESIDGLLEDAANLRVRA